MGQLVRIVQTVQVNPLPFITQGLPKLSKFRLLRVECTVESSFRAKETKTKDDMC
jgi:hypothetical protein